MRANDTLTCTIELLSDDHVDAFHRLAQHPSLPLTSSVPPDCPMSHVKAWVTGNTSASPSTLTFAVLVADVPVGIVTLKRLDSADGSGEVSYWIGEGFRGKGHAKSAARLIVRYAFEVLKLRYLHSHYLGAGNPVSRGVLHAVGFRLDATRPDLPTTTNVSPDDRFALTFRTIVGATSGWTRLNSVGRSPFRRIAVPTAARAW